MAKKKKKSSGSGFRVFLLLYSLILCVSIGFGLCWLWKYLESYEMAQSNIAVERYEKNKMEAEFDANLNAYAQSLTTPLQSGDEILAYIKDQMGEVSLRLKKDRNTDSSAAPVYSILKNGHEMGRLYTKYVPLKFGMKAITVDRTEWQLEGDFASSFQVIAPKEAKISVNGIQLNEQNSTVETAEHSMGDLTQGFEPVYDTLYTFDYFGIPAPQIAQGENVEYVMEQEEGGRFSFFTRCDVQTVAVLKPIAEQFVNDYILFTSNAASYALARKHVANDTPLYNRISGSVDGMRWVAGVTSKISDLTVNNFVPFGDGVFCEAHYKLTDTAGGVMESNMRILYIQYQGMWKVYNIQMY